jgi:hypothetical protein
MYGWGVSQTSGLRDRSTGEVTTEEVVEGLVELGAGSLPVLGVHAASRTNRPVTIVLLKRPILPHALGVA